MHVTGCPLSPRDSRAQIQFRDELGSSLVELAVVLPILMMVVTGIMVFAIALNNYITLTFAVDQGARLLAISRGQTLDPCATAASAITQSAATLSSGSFTYTFILNGTSYSGATCSSTSTSTGAAGNLVQGSSAEVLVKYPCNLTIYGGASTAGCMLTAKTTELVQ